jgi:cytochrome c oxidase subunit III
MSQSLDDHSTGEHPPYLAHHFKTMDQQTSAGKLGMWVFMGQEVLFFSGLFCAFGFVKHMYPDMVLEAQKSMNVVLGTLNTVILLVSSLTMSLCVRSTRVHQPRASVIFLCVTMICGLVFLSIKGYEWMHHLHEGYYPGKFFQPSAHAEVTASMAHVFFGMYYVMTGMHALHIVVGLGLMCWMLKRLLSREFNFEHYVALENTSLFWHLVDIVWIFLFPVLYLVK